VFYGVVLSLAILSLWQHLREQIRAFGAYSVDGISTAMHVGAALVFLWLLWDLVGVRQESRRMLAFSSRLILSEEVAKETLCSLYDVLRFGQAMGWSVVGNISTLKTNPKMVRWHGWLQLFLAKQMFQVVVVSVGDSACRLSIKASDGLSIPHDVAKQLMASGRGIEVES